MGLKRMSFALIEGTIFRRIIEKEKIQRYK